MAAVGTNQLKTFQLLAEEFNKSNASGVKFEIVPMDNKLSPQETTAVLRSAMDQGVRYVSQGNGSGPALAIMDALEKHNNRNKGKELLYLNYAAVDPDLTNGKCSYWHFRLDADTSMKMEALTTFMKDDAEVKKVYLINQNYGHGQQVSKYAKDLLKKSVPMCRSWAMTSRLWLRYATLPLCGQDQAVGRRYGDHRQLGRRFVAAAQGSQRCGPEQRQVLYLLRLWCGAPTAMGAASDGKVFTVGYGHYNMGPPIQASMASFKKKFNDDLTQASIYHVFALLDAAFVKTGSTDPVKVAAALEGMKIKSFNGEVEMRKSDHQLQQGLYITKWQKQVANIRMTRRTPAIPLPREVLRALCGQHADQLPDEAAFLSREATAVKAAAQAYKHDNKLRASAVFIFSKARPVNDA